MTTPTPELGLARVAQLSTKTKHPADWELVTDIDGPTLPEILAKYIRMLEEPNGYPVEPFMPLYEAITRKLEKRAKWNAEREAALVKTRTARAIAARKAKRIAKNGGAE